MPISQTWILRCTGHLFMPLFDPVKEVRGVAVDYPQGRKRVRVTVRDSDAENYQTVEIDDPFAAQSNTRSLQAATEHESAYDRGPEIEGRLREQVSYQFGTTKDQVRIPRHVMIKMG